MTEYAAGTVAEVTWDDASLAAQKRGESNVKTQRAIYTDDGYWSLTTGHLSCIQGAAITDVRPLVVLDLDGIDAVELAREIRDARDSWADIADQIAGHAKPRFPLGAHVRYIGDNPVDAWRKRRSKKHLGIVVKTNGSDYVRVYDTVENEWWVADEGSLAAVEDES